MTVTAHTPPFALVDWSTIPAAVAEHGLPAAIIQEAIKAGDVRARMVAGETLVNRAELRALRLRLMAERGCDGCD